MFLPHGLHTSDDGLSGSLATSRSFVSSWWIPDSHRFPLVRGRHCLRTVWTAQGCVVQSMTLRPSETPRKFWFNCRPQRRPRGEDRSVWEDPPKGHKREACCQWQENYPTSFTMLLPAHPRGCEMTILRRILRRAARQSLGPPIRLPMSMGLVRMTGRANCRRCLRWSLVVEKRR
jgi:hypothetical protein